VRGLSLAEQFGFMVAPVNTRDETVMDALVDFATQYAQASDVRLRVEVDLEIPKVSYSRYSTSPMENNRPIRGFNSGVCVS
jgi:hypothetical protein